MYNIKTHACITSPLLLIINIIQNPKLGLIIEKQLVQVYKTYSVAKQPTITAPYSFTNRVKYFFSIDTFLELAEFKNFCPEF